MEIQLFHLRTDSIIPLMLYALMSSKPEDVEKREKLGIKDRTIKGGMAKSEAVYSRNIDDCFRYIAYDQSVFPDGIFCAGKTG